MLYVMTMYLLLCEQLVGKAPFWSGIFTFFLKHSMNELEELCVIFPKDVSNLILRFTRKVILLNSKIYVVTSHGVEEYI